MKKEFIDNVRKELELFYANDQTKKTMEFLDALLHDFHDDKAKSVKDFLKKVTSDLDATEDKDSGKLIPSNSREEISKFTSKMNFVPSNIKGICHDFCVGIASTGFGTEKGLRGVMRDVISIWLSCYDTNKETLILTVDWADETFNNHWLPILEAYKRKGNVISIIQYTEKGMLLHYPK